MNKAIHLVADLLSMRSHLLTHCYWLPVVLSGEVLPKPHGKPHGNAQQPFVSHPHSVNSNYTASMLTLT